MGWLAFAAPAFADVTLLDDGRWRVIGVEDAGPPQIAASVDGVPAGSFSELRFLDAASGFAQVLALHGDGTLAPQVAGAPAGATATLGSYWECELGLIGPLRIVALDLPERSKKNGVLRLEGQLSNGDSLVSDELDVRIQPPHPERTQVELAYRLVATREICIDRERRDAPEEFHVVEIAAKFRGPGAHSNDLARYVRTLRLDCDLFDCDIDRISFCAPLENATGYVLDNPSRLDGRRLGLFHTSNVPEPTPTLGIEMRSPSPHSIAPQGFVTENADPDARNVAFWADWVDVRGRYADGRKLAWFRFMLEAEAPRAPGCDRVQD